MLEDKIKHLEFIQENIARMNKNSFQLKGWMITVVSALMALYASSNNLCYIWIAIVPTVIFWLLDSFYLQQERKFRGVYDDVAEISPKDERKRVRNFEMPINNYKYGKYCYFNNLFSTTVAGLYGLVILGLIIIGMLLNK